MSNLSNILKFIAEHDYTNSSFEKKCGLPNATLSNAKKRGSDLTTDVVETISKSMGSDLEAAGYHIMDMRPFGRQELAILSSEEAEKIVSSLENNAPNDRNESVKEKPSLVDDRAELKEAMATIRDYNVFLQKMLETSLEKILKDQIGNSALTGELLRRDFRREADGNADVLKQILEDFLQRIGPKLGSSVIHDIAAGDGR